MDVGSFCGAVRRRRRKRERAERIDRLLSRTKKEFFVISLSLSLYIFSQAFEDASLSDSSSFETANSKCIKVRSSEEKSWVAFNINRRKVVN